MNDEHMLTGNIIVALVLALTLLACTAIGPDRLRSIYFEPYSTQWSCSTDDDAYFIDCADFPHEFKGI